MKTHVFSRLLLLAAGFILCLHGVVPHVHGPAARTAQTGVVSEDNQQTSKLLDFLSDFISSDLGEDHLEHFSQEQGPDFASLFACPLPPAAHPTIAYAAAPIAVSVRRTRIFRSRYFPPSAVYPDDEAPRGPPTFA